MEINRGQIYSIDLGESNKVGSEQKGRKLGVVVQNKVGNKYSPTVIIAVITSSMTKQSLPTHVMIPDSIGMYKKSMILAEQIFTVSKDRLIKHIATLEDLSQLNKAIRISLELE